ncbi:hypothetical protein OKW34_001085 [Paraburkholderia youngii]|uniref:Uncharacterized protein n=1 Tax=Paraburkholderia youngii TaxID=2782701 RepID=A0A7W8P4U0_9BURK|nr:hypothetical protein [Paraburkholderia youngii]
MVALNRFLSLILRYRMSYFNAPKWRFDTVWAGYSRTYPTRVTLAEI